MSVEPRADIVDGFEVYNSGNILDEDVKAFDLAQMHPGILTSGGDCHAAWDEKIGMSGVLLSERVHSSREFADALKQRRHGLMIRRRAVETLKREDLE